MNVQTMKKNKLPLLIHREEKLAIRNQKTMHTSESVQNNHLFSSRNGSVIRIYVWFGVVVSSVNPISIRHKTLIYVLPSCCYIPP